MKITLLVSVFNSVTQAYFTYLKREGHSVDVVYARSSKQIKDDIFQFYPDIILSPFLKEYIPAEVFNNIPTYVLHPGIIGDRGAYSIDNAIREGKKEWGVVLLRADEEYDGGDIYADVNFLMRDSYKASIYRNEVFHSALEALKILLKNLQLSSFIPQKQEATQMHLQLTQEDREIDWQKDTTEEIIRKIYMSDSHPGVLDNILGVECYLYGAWYEEKLYAERPKEILAKRAGAICLSTIDGALWITHLKEKNRFKLPATYVLKERLQGIKEVRLPLIFDKSYKTFYEISCDIVGNRAYLYFNFHNGAFRAEQCMKLKYAIEYLKDQVDIIILMGGEDFFSNGINLNILEDSKKSGEDGWSNINAINDLIKSILFAENVITVASLHKNAGAGGLFLATACDYVVADAHVVLNPHYKTLGLSGSEYHTYTLPKRVGEKLASKLLSECLPVDGFYAKEIGLVDELIERDYKEGLEKYLNRLFSDKDWIEDFLWDKEDFLEDNREKIEKCRENEIEVMYPEFWDPQSEFHQLRYNFVYKICPIKTPKRLRYA